MIVSQISSSTSKKSFETVESKFTTRASECKGMLVYAFTSSVVGHQEAVTTACFHTIYILYDT